jgi:hypothetical protein
MNERNYAGYYVDRTAMIIGCGNLAVLLLAILLYSECVVLVQHMLCVYCLLT